MIELHTLITNMIMGLAWGGKFIAVEKLSSADGLGR